MKVRNLLGFHAILAAALAVAVAFPAGGSAAQEGLDMDQIFRCAATDDAGKAQCLEARNIITNNCTICHTFVPIVMQQFDADGWRGLLERHVSNGRVNQLKPEQIDQIHAYLSANFNGELPPPELPPELLATWTAY